MTSPVDPVLEAQQLREKLRLLEAKIARDAADLHTKEQRIRWLDAKVQKLSHEMAILRRWKFGRTRESLDAEQLSLIDEAVDADLAAIEVELDGLRDKGATSNKDKQQPKREPLPASLARTDIHHEPESTQCTTTGCGAPMQRIGEDVTEKLDYEPGQFSVQRHVRGKWVCRCCERLVQEPMPPTIIDKGIATTALLAHVLISKYLDHQPLARQENIFARAGVRIARSTLAEWVGATGQQLMPLVQALRAALLECAVVHADETPVQMLKPEGKRDGKTHRAYLGLCQWRVRAAQSGGLRL